MLPTFHDPHLFELAMTHRSATNDGTGRQSNERLEFLGDAVLELATTKFLFNRFTDAQEGILTTYRSSLVNRFMLSALARELKLGEQMIMSRGEEQAGGRENMALLENTFEAFIGALYLDQGYDACENFLQTNLFPRIDDVIANNLHTNHKSVLQEHVQSQGKATPIYETLEAVGPDHDKTFTMAVILDGEQFATGTGKSKQDATQDAAKHALEKLQII